MPREHNQVMLRHRFKAKHYTLFLTAVALLIGCTKDRVTIWSSKQLSPNGEWLASASTTQYTGPGTASVITLVYLERPKISKSSTEVLEFFHDPELTDNSTNLIMEWLDNSHLQVKYVGRADLQLQVAKYSGIFVVVRQTP